MDLLTKAHELLEALRKGNRGHSMFGFISSNGDVNNMKSHICYAAIGHLESTDLVYMADVELSHPADQEKLAKDKAEAYQYLYWLCNISFFADAFITKDPEEHYTEGAILDCKYPAPYIIAAAASARYVKEFPGIVKRWLEFKDFINPDAALYAAHFFVNLEGETVYRLQHEGNWNHQWADPLAKPDELARLINHDFSERDTLPPMKTAQGYRDMSRVFRAGKTGPHSPAYGNKRFFTFLKEPTGFGGKTTNSFGYPLPTADVTYYKKDMGVWLNEFVTLNYQPTKETALGQAPEAGVHRNVSSAPRRRRKAAKPVD